MTAAPDELTDECISSAASAYERLYIDTEGQCSPEDVARTVIAAAIRQHSAPLEAQIAELTAERDKAIKERNAFRDTGKAFVAGLGDRLQCADDALSASLVRERALREALNGADGLMELIRNISDRTETHRVDWRVLLSPPEARAIAAALQTKEDGNG